MALTLATVDAAIEALLTGSQSFTIDGQTYTQVGLGPLMEMRKQLKSEGGTGGASPFGFRMTQLKPPEH